MIHKNKFVYSLLEKAFERQIKTIGNQEEKQIKTIKEHGKQFFEINMLDKKRLFQYLW